MAAGNAYQGNGVLAGSNATFDIKPSVGVEAVLHNVWWTAPTSGQVQLIKTDGTNAVQFDSDTTAGGRQNLQIHISNTVWLQLKNTGSANITYGYDGMQTV